MYMKAKISLRSNGGIARYCAPSEIRDNELKEMHDAVNALRKLGFDIWYKLIPNDKSETVERA
jgi:hypothetical protein